VLDKTKLLAPIFNWNYLNFKERYSANLLS
jgi:hypothetical protein